MDRISNVKGIIWLFAGMVLFYLLAVIFSLGIWVKGEKTSFYSMEKYLPYWEL